MGPRGRKQKLWSTLPDCVIRKCNEREEMSALKLPSNNALFQSRLEYGQNLFESISDQIKFSLPHHFSICMVPLLFDRYWCRSKVLGGIFQSTKENFAGVTSIWIWFPSPCFRSGFILFGGFNFSYWRHGLLFMDYGAGLIPWQLIFRRCVSKHNKFFFKTQSVFSAHHDEKFLLYHGLGHSHDFHFPFPSFPVQQLVSHFIYRFLYGETIWKKSP